MSPNRVVALITPLAAPLAGWVATQAATQLPGLELPKSALEEVFIAVRLSHWHRPPNGCTAGRSGRLRWPRPRRPCR